MFTILNGENIFITNQRSSSLETILHECVHVYMDVDGRAHGFNKRNDDDVDEDDDDEDDDEIEGEKEEEEEEEEEEKEEED